MRAIQIPRTGPPDVLALAELPDPSPGPGQALVRIAFAGVNFIDCYHRSGLYPVGPLPAPIGKEGAGTVVAVGAGVTSVAVGDRVAYFDATGGYAEQVVHPADRLLPVPPGLGLDQAAALPLQGMTAHYLTRTIHRVATGDQVLIHAAAGGVGLLAVQIARHFGAEVFATCSTTEKAERVRAAGAHHVILYGATDFAAEVLRLTGGRGVDLTLDSVGRTTLQGSVRATRVRGHLVLFGQSSGLPDPIQPRQLLGSRTLTSASLFDYARSREELLERSADVFGWVGEGWLRVTIDRVLPLRDAAEAHRSLEGRATIGKLLLAP